MPNSSSQHLFEDATHWRKRAAEMRTLAVTNTVGEKELRAAGAEVVTQNLADWTPDAVHLVYESH